MRCIERDSAVGMGGSVSFEDPWTFIALVFVEEMRFHRFSNAVQSKNLLAWDAEKPRGNVIISLSHSDDVLNLDQARTFVRSS